MSEINIIYLLFIDKPIWKANPIPKIIRTKEGNARILKVETTLVNVEKATYLMQLHILMLRINIRVKNSF